MILYHYWRSSSSWRVRWALDLKGLSYEKVAVNLLDGESESPEHLKRNPLGFVPVLERDGKYMIESVAIIEWLEENHPIPSLFPKDSFDKAHVRALVQIINADIQPVQNLTVQDHYSQDPEKRKEWARFFIHRGFQAYEKLLEKSSGLYSWKDQITVADLFLIPQVYNALRNGVDLAEFPKIGGIYEAALKTPACQSSHPDRYKPN